jgi:hypothetical protein
VVRKLVSHQFEAFTEPGALLAMLLVLLTMGFGDLAIFVALRGWPF